MSEPAAGTEVEEKEVDYTGRGIGKKVVIVFTKETEISLLHYVCEQVAMNTQAICAVNVEPNRLEIIWRKDLNHSRVNSVLNSIIIDLEDCVESFRFD